MKKMTRSTHRLIISMLVMALLVMALPMTIVAKGRPADNPGLAKGLAKQTDKQKLDDEEEEKSVQALIVAARNEWAKSLELDPKTEIKMTPGHANLLLKYLLSLPEDVQQDDPASPIDPLADPEAFKQSIMDMLQGLLDDEIFKEKYFVDGHLDVKVYMHELKANQIMVTETEDPVVPTP